MLGSHLEVGLWSVRDSGGVPSGGGVVVPPGVSVEVSLDVGL